jgi:hypothetical protein
VQTENALTGENERILRPILIDELVAACEAVPEGPHATRVLVTPAAVQEVTEALYTLQVPPHPSPAPRRPPPAANRPTPPWGALLARLASSQQASGPLCGGVAATSTQARTLKIHGSHGSSASSGCAPSAATGATSTASPPRGCARPRRRAPPPPAGCHGARRRFISEEDYAALAARGLLPPTLAPLAGRDNSGGMWRGADPGVALEALSRQGEAELQALYAVPPQALYARALVRVRAWYA